MLLRKVSAAPPAPSTPPANPAIPARLATSTADMSGLRTYISNMDWAVSSKDSSDASDPKPFRVSTTNFLNWFTVLPSLVITCVGFLKILEAAFSKPGANLLNPAVIKPVANPATVASA